ncbi:MAG TPA: carboxypeptidase-like regulatory domain-containing protein, partial [Flavobacterium sp.]|nr:carboxypeptidase-like regulatory domain-containing protein [Flavobacterium sp.]
MKYFVVFFFLILSSTAFSQVIEPVQTVTGTIINDNTKFPLPNVNIININKVRGTTTDEKGNFELAVSVNDTLHITIIGFQSLRVRVTNDWVKTKTTKIQLTEKAYALEEVVVGRYNLTGYIEVDSKLIPVKENYRYSISGLTEG